MTAMFEGFRAMAHLLEQLGEKRFVALISSDNTGKVKDFCDQLLENTLPTELTNIGPEKRHYDLLGFLQGDEKSVVGHVMVDRAKEMKANLGEDDGRYLLDHQQDIPVALRGKVMFVFPDWLPSGSHVRCIFWNDDEWVQDWGWLGYDHWGDGARVLRRKHK